MAPRTPKPPNGLNRPSARSRPPPNSPTAATQVQNQAGVNRCLAIPAVVFSMPPPPNQPNSFCEPCAATVRPTPTRRIKRPIASAMRKSPRITNLVVRTRLGLDPRDHAHSLCMVYHKPLLLCQSLVFHVLSV